MFIDKGEMQTVWKIDKEETCISYLFSYLKLMNYTKMYSLSQIYETLYVKSEYNFGLNKSSKVMKIASFLIFIIHMQLIINRKGITSSGEVTLIGLAFDRLVSIHGLLVVPLPPTDAISAPLVLVSVFFLIFALHQ